LVKGLVIKSTGSWYTVRDVEGNTVACKIRGSYRIKGLRSTNPVAVGDRVEFSVLDDGSGIISHIEDRKNYIIRRASNLSREYQLIASNIDQAVLVISLVQPKTLMAFVDRFLVSAEAFRIPVVLLFNKLDLYGEEELIQMNSLVEIYENIGYQCLAVSLKSGLHTDKLRALFAGSTSVVSGNSGVGKSTLLNFLDPELNLKTSEVSSSHQSGQHTTTYAEMFLLPSGGYVIDTPGIKGFGTVDIEKNELFHFFPEIFKISAGCRFHNCLHLNEPGCAVIDAVISGEISESRYLSYLGLMSDMGDKYRK